MTPTPRPLASALLLLTLCTAAAAQTGNSGPWRLQPSGSTAGLRGIHTVSSQIAWASGTAGTILRTTDAGHTWQRCTTPPGADQLDFRGVWAWDAKTAMAMSSGPGDLSRIYKTTDGCASWKLLFTNPGPKGFWDAIQCFDSTTCYLLGDPVRNEFQLWHTESGGAHWLLEQNRSPRAKSSLQGVFAASNSSMTLGVRTIFTPMFGSGGNGGAYFYRSMGGESCMDDCIESNSPAESAQWLRVLVPVAHGTDSSGVFSLAFRDLHHGVAVGGDYTKPNSSAGTAAWSSDGGRHWHAASHPPHGFRSAVAWDAAAHAWIAAGTNGSDISYDDGRTWQPLDNGNWNAISLPWIVGPHGRIARLDPSRLPQPATGPTARPAAHPQP